MRWDLLSDQEAAQEGTGGHRNDLAAGMHALIALRGSLPTSTGALSQSGMPKGCLGWWRLLLVWPCVMRL